MKTIYYSLSLNEARKLALLFNRFGDPVLDFLPTLEFSRSKLSVLTAMPCLSNSLGLCRFLHNTFVRRATAGEELCKASFPGAAEDFVKGSIPAVTTAKEETYDAYSEEEYKETRDPPW